MKMRRILAAVAAAVMLVCLVLPVGAASEMPKIYAASYTVTSFANAVDSDGVSGFSAGTVDITLNIANSIGTVARMSVDPSSSFTMRDGRQFIEGISGGGVSLPLTYSGSGKTLVVTFYYTTITLDEKNLPVQTEQSYTQSILISEAVDKSQLPDSGGDAYFRIDGDVPELAAGDTGRLTFKLTNTTSYNATNVSVKVNPSDVLRPISGMNTFEIGRMAGGNTTTIDLNVIALAAAKTGIQTLDVEIGFNNGSGAYKTQTAKLSVSITNREEDDPTYKASVTVSGVRVNSQIPAADGSMTLYIDFTNSGKEPSGQITAALGGFGGESSPIALGESMPTKTLPSLASGETNTIEYKLKIGKNTATANYPLSLSTKWSGGTLDSTIYVPIMKQPSVDGNQLVITKVSQNKTMPGSDNIIELSVTVTNYGTVRAVSTLLTFKDLASTTVTLKSGLNQKALGEIDPGKSVTGVIQLYVSPTLTAGNYPLTAVTSCRSSEKDGETGLFVTVTRPANFGKTEDTTKPTEETLPIPQIMLESYSTPTEIITAGDTFKLNFTIKNTSKTVAVSNMKLTLTQADGVFLPASGSNSFYVDSLAPEGFASFEIELTAKRDAESKSYPITIAMDFQDPKGKQYDVTESLSLPITQPQRLEVENIAYYPFGMDPAPLSFQYINKGRATLFNLTITIEGPFTSANGPKYVGNYAASSTDYFEDTLTPTETGNLVGTIVFEYEDAVGKLQRKEEQFSAFVDETASGGGDVVDPTNPDAGGDTGGDVAAGEDVQFDENGNPIYPGDPGYVSPSDGKILGLDAWMFWLGVGIAGVVVAVVVIFIVRKRRDKKLLDDDDD